MQDPVYRQAAVLYMGYTSRKMLLFLPQRDGEDEMWRTTSTNFDQIKFQDDADVVAFIDVPEEGPYASIGECRILKFVLTDAEKHVRNWETMVRRGRQWVRGVKGETRTV